MMGHFDAQDSDPRITVFADVRELRESQVRTTTILERMTKQLDGIEHRLVGERGDNGLCNCVAKHGVQIRLLWTALIAGLTAGIGIVINAVTRLK